MEHLLYGISAINFNHCNEETNENCAPNHCMSTSSGTDSRRMSMAFAAEDVLDFNCLPPVPITHFQALVMNARPDAEAPTAAADFEKTVQKSEQHESDELDSSTDDIGTSSTSSYECIRRKLPTRAAKETNLLSKTKRRGIMKPTKRLSKTASDLSSLRPADIRRIYLNKKLTNFHPSKLETIFEEPQPETHDTESQVSFIGSRKFKRSLSCCDGLNTTKTLIKQRRMKIKKTFGHRFALKKIPLDDFLQHINISADCADMAECELNAEQNQQTEDEQQPTSTAMLQMDAEESKEAQYIQTTSVQATAELLLPMPHGGSIMKSHSFSGGSVVAVKPLENNANKVL